MTAPTWLARTEGRLFDPPDEGAGGGGFRAVFLAALFVAGGLLWGYILNWGDMRLTAHDWPRQYMYFVVERQALAEQVVPYHISRYLYGTDAFLAIPEIIVSPQVVLLTHLPFGRFVLVNVLLLYAVGFAGCLLLRRRYRMPAAAFAFFFLLFNFNGHIVSHLAVGHQWYGYFFLPFYCLLTLRLAEGDTRLRVSIGLAFVMLAIYLQASFHMAVWCLIFLGLVFLFCPGRRLAALWAAVFWALLAAFRILPGVVEFHAGGYSFRNGYPSLYEMFQAFVSIREYSAPKIGGVFGEEGWWEYDIHIGLGALVAVLFLGLVARRLKSWRLEGLRYEALDLPLLFMFIFALSYFYALIAWLPLPFANVERVSSRFLVLPFLIVLTLACARAGEAFDRLRDRRWARWLIVAGVAETALCLVNHAAVWRVGALEAVENVFVAPDMAVRIVSRPWGGYETALAAGCVISAVAAISLVVLLFIPRRPVMEERP
jgi:hypothetical protein